jgi:archaemetzincin
MSKIRLTTLIGMFLCLLAACAKEESKEAKSVLPPAGQNMVEIPEKYKKLRESLVPFFKPMGKPAAGEWLASFKEGGQTFEQYFSGRPTLPTSERRTIYIQPIGKFGADEERVIKLTARYMEIFFNLSVKLLPVKKFEEPLSLKNYRIHPEWKIKQIRSGYVLDEVLLPHLPADAAALIAFTAEDLYPDESMNFVFGQASLENRVGVWSLYRLEEGADFADFLTRTLKIGVHETGHMFSIYHCTKYECVMSGSNHLGETDRHPLDACPECTAKICWMTDCAEQKRFTDLAEFCAQNVLKKEGDLFAQKAEAVKTAD